MILVHFIDRNLVINDNLVLSVTNYGTTDYELLVKGGIVSREQLVEAHKKEQENNSSIGKGNRSLRLYYRRSPRRLSRSNSALSALNWFLPT
jgi:hypothetical protein